MSFDPETVIPPGARIKVIGVGGGGGNAVNTMIRSGLEGADFVTCNTDVQALRFSLAGLKLQIGKDLTRGLGAGADPDVGRDAALEDRHEIQEILQGADMVFITAGMGGGTGTGGASVVAQIARELGALTVAVVTKPFAFEGKRRRKHADAGIARLRECVDTLITIPNQRLLQVASPQLSMIDAFKMADDVLVNAVRGISDIINIPGTVNVDFADVKTVMSCMGQALMGIGAASGEHRAVEAARMAISSPLLEDIDIEGATGILINITAGSNVTLMEVNEACSIIQEAAHEDANIIFGAVIDETLGDQIRVTVIATGFPVDKEEIDPVEGVKNQQQSIQTFGTRLTSPGLITPKAQARPATQPHMYAPLTKRPEAQKVDASKPTATGAVPAAPARMEAPQVTVPVREVAPAPTYSPGPMIGATTAELRREPQFEAPIAHFAAPVVPSQPAPVAREAREEAQELARWTLDTLGSDALTGADIPSLAADVSSELTESDRAVERDLEIQAPAPFALEPRMEGARAGADADDDFAEQATETPAETLADSLFDSSLDADLSFDAEEEFLLGGQRQAASQPSPQEEVRAGAVKQAAPLESFFDQGHGVFIATDIDRKIDEALELAERMRQPQKKAQGPDELDVPAFLRNGMKDLPLE